MAFRVAELVNMDICFKTFAMVASNKNAAGKMYVRTSRPVPAAKRRLERNRQRFASESNLRPIFDAHMILPNFPKASFWIQLNVAVSPTLSVFSPKARSNARVPNTDTVAEMSRCKTRQRV